MVRGIIAVSICLSGPLLSRRISSRMRQSCINVVVLKAHSQNGSFGIQLSLAMDLKLAD